MSTIRNIVFDLGGVLIDWNPRYLYRKLFSDDQDMEFFLREVCHGHWNEQLDGGRDFAEACAVLADQWPQYKEPILAYYHRWPEMLQGSLDETVEILNYYHQHPAFHLFAITNWSAQTYPVALELYPFLQWFTDVVVSGQEKLLKPQAEIYQLLLRRNSLEAGESLFIDDNPANVVGARAVGMSALLFTSPQQLKKDLGLLGLYPAL